VRHPKAVELGQAIRRARKDAGLTQADLGAFVGDADRHVVAAIERGEVTTQLQRLLDIVDALGLEIALRPRTQRLAASGNDPHGAAR